MWYKASQLESKNEIFGEKKRLDVVELIKNQVGPYKERWPSMDLLLTGNRYNTCRISSDWSTVGDHVASVRDVKVLRRQSLTLTSCHHSFDNDEWKKSAWRNKREILLPKIDSNTPALVGTVTAAAAVTASGNAAAAARLGSGTSRKDDTQNKNGAGGQMISNLDNCSQSNEEVDGQQERQSLTDDGDQGIAHLSGASRDKPMDDGTAEDLANSVMEEHVKMEYDVDPENTAKELYNEENHRNKALKDIQLEYNYIMSRARQSYRRYVDSFNRYSDTCRDKTTACPPSSPAVEVNDNGRNNTRQASLYTMSEPSFFSSTHCLACRHNSIERQLTFKTLGEMRNEHKCTRLSKMSDEKLSCDTNVFWRRQNPFSGIRGRQVKCMRKVTAPRVEQMRQVNYRFYPRLRPLGLTF